jgi:hypothetical protein
MAIHILKLAVGVDDLAHLAALQEHYTVSYDGVPAVPVRTRFKPAKSDETLNGGSLYRVIKNRIQCRQQILGYETADSADRGTQCLIMVSPVLMQTVSVAQRPFQGWRYLEPKDAPADRGAFDPLNDADIAPEMAQDLRALGLI